MDERPVSHYAHELRRSLPASVFSPVPSRVFWLLLHLGIIVAGVAAIAFHVGGWSGRIALSLLIGHSFAGAAFVAHETLHGSVVRGRRARTAIGWLAFLPFAISPTLWAGWHNRVHHAHTAQSGVDPDTYATLERYHESRAVRVVDHLSVGCHRWGGLVTLLFGLTGQSLIALIQGGAAFGLSARQHRAAIMQTIAAAAVWALVGFIVGPAGFVFAFIIPLMVGNAVVMGYILTNHSLSPLTRLNDPLLNSLSVTTPRLLDVLHLSFGFHVEHHLFPAMSPRNAPVVRQLLRQRWPERYQSMPLAEAFRLLWRTPRVYQNATTLLDPRGQERWQTLTPSSAASSVHARRRGAEAPCSPPSSTNIGAPDRSERRSRGLLGWPRESPRR